MLTTHGIREGSKADRPDEAKVKEREKEREKGEEDEGSSDQEKERAKEKEGEKAALTWWVKEVMRKNGKKEIDWNESYEGYWGNDYNWNEGYWASDDLYYLDEYGYFQKKGKGKGKGKGKKGKKGKDDDGKGGKPGDGKGKSNYVQPQTTSTPAIQNQQQQQAHYSSAASSSGHGFFAFAETEPARVEVLTATYAEREEHRRTRRGGQNQRDATAQHNRRELKKFPVLVGDLDALHKVYKDVQLLCPGKLVYKKVRLHGSHWQKAHHCFHMDAL